MPNSYTLEERLAILYHMAWLNGTDGDKEMNKWKQKAKELLELEDGDK